MAPERPVSSFCKSVKYCNASVCRPAPCNASPRLSRVCGSPGSIALGPIEKISRLGELSHFQAVRTLLAKRCERAAISISAIGRLGWLQNAVRHARTG